MDFRMDGATIKRNPHLEVFKTPKRISCVKLRTDHFMKRFAFFYEVIKFVC
jgi:hypothetical protein